MSKTATTVVTAEQIIAEVRRLAAEQPDFIYEKPAGSTFCLYKHGDGPGCIMGQALNNLGVEVDEFTTGTIGSVLIEKGIKTTRGQGDWLRDVQAQQDTRHTWAQSVADADEWV